MERNKYLLITACSVAVNENGSDNVAVPTGDNLSLVGDRSIKIAAGGTGRAKGTRYS